MRREQPTLIAVVIRRVGFIKARTVLQFTACWWIASADLGRAPETVDEYCDWWRTNRRKGFREQAAFRQAWPEFDTPTELAEALGYDFSNLHKGDETSVVVDLLGWAAPA